MGRVQSPRISEEDLERALMAMAYIISRHGEVYIQIFDRLEAEMLEARRRQAPIYRARRYLEAHTIPGGLRAIR